MEKDNQTLIKIFSDLYLLEKQARDLYTDFLKTLKDPKEIKIVKHIRDQEKEHMKIAKELLSLAK